MGKISSYTVLPAASAADELIVVDVSDTSMAPTGTDKILTAAAAMAAPQAATSVSGFPLQNATPTILVWSAPNDGQMHRFTYYSSLTVTGAMTGGQIQLQFTTPDGTANFHVIYAGGFGTGQQTQNQAWQNMVVKAGTTVAIVQGSALTAGAASLWAEIWGS